jgi:hypothetical protein
VNGGAAIALRTIMHLRAILGWLGILVVGCSASTTTNAPDGGGADSGVDAGERTCGRNGDGGRCVPNGTPCDRCEGAGSPNDAECGSGYTCCHAEPHGACSDAGNDSGNDAGNDADATSHADAAGLTCGAGADGGRCVPNGTACSPCEGTRGSDDVECGHGFACCLNLPHGPCSDAGADASHD